MRALIPAAGQGTRLYPQTHTKPKAMVRLAGKPILGHILSNLSNTRIEEVVVVVGGPMQEQIVDYATTSFGDQFDLEFVEQTIAKGLGHSIYQAESVARDEPLMILLGDMLFENPYEEFLETHQSLDDCDGSIGVKPVDEPQHYGVVETDGDFKITQFVEKPDDPPSDLAISGVYIINDTETLFDELEELIANDRRGSGGEFQLTDALQEMLNSGSDLRYFEVDDWYDCGRPETLLEANRLLLRRLETNSATELEDTIVVPPVDFGDNVSVEKSVVGPNVSVDNNTSISNSIVRESIVGQNATLDTVNLNESIVGNNTEVQGEANHLNVGDNSTIRL